MSHTSVMVAGRYRLADPIAVGGMGEVWRAADTVLDRLVAVKLLRAEYAEHAETLIRFRAEARHAASLSHPGIAQVYDYGEGGPGHAPYLVMELVLGPSLAEVLASGPLDPACAMDIVAQTAAGLDAAHAAGLVHRDIKPGNLLLDPSGRVKITDFGVAHAAGSAPVTRTGSLIGTPAYLAPERVAGEPAAAASDLYSLGIVAYECLAGAPPFTGVGVEVALAHRDRPLPPLSATVPAQVAALVGELTAKNPAARPASAGEAARRAGQLRDALASGTCGLPGGSPGLPAATLTRLTAATLSDVHPATLSDVHPATLGDMHPATLGEVPPLGPRPARPRLLRDRLRPARSAVLAVAAVAVTAGLVGWLLAGMLGAAARHRDPAVRPSATATPSAMADVNGGALDGRPVAAARRQLRQLGLRVRVTWRPSGQWPPGTVLAVQPVGQVPIGSIVVVTAALQPAGHGHGHRHGNGGGHGKGNGGDGNGGGD